MIAHGCSSQFGAPAMAMEKSMNRLDSSMVKVGCLWHVDSGAARCPWC